MFCLEGPMKRRVMKKERIMIVSSKREELGRLMKEKEWVGPWRPMNQKGTRSRREDSTVCC